MKKIQIIFFLLALVACNSSVQKTENNETIEPPKKEIVDYEGKHFFDFDEVVHYYVNFEHEKIYTLHKEEISATNETLKELFFDYDIHSSNYNSLEKLGFNKKIIDVSKYEKLNTIFSQRKAYDHTATACEPIFRDILVFKKKSKINGIAKICFDCGKYSIKGALVSTQDFGQSGEYSSLATLLNKKD